MQKIKFKVKLSHFTHSQQGLTLVSGYFLVTPFSVHLQCAKILQPIFSVLCSISNGRFLASSRKLTKRFTNQPQSHAALSYPHKASTTQLSAVRVSHKLKGRASSSISLIYLQTRTCSVSAPPRPQRADTRHVLLRTPTLRKTMPSKEHHLTPFNSLVTLANVQNHWEVYTK